MASELAPPSHWTDSAQIIADDVRLANIAAPPPPPYGVYESTASTYRSWYSVRPSGVCTLATLTYRMLCGFETSGPRPPRFDHASCE